MSSSILPAPGVTNPVALSGLDPNTLKNLGATGFDPQVAIDPLNHLKMVEVHVAPNTVNPATFGSFVLSGNYTTDGGQTWHLLTFPDTDSVTGLLSANNPDPNTGPPGNPIVSFAVAESPSITFDRAEQFYIVSDQHSTDNTSGAIVLDKFNFSGATVSQVALTPTQSGGLYQNNLSNSGDISEGSNILYRWESSTGQDIAYNPIVTVDANDPSYTDPTTGQTQTDSMANMLGGFPKAVYVAWNTNFTEPQVERRPTLDPATLSRIMLEASADGGTSFSTVQNVSGATFLNTSAPQAVFTQGSVDGIPGGQLTFVWNIQPSAAPKPPTIDVAGSQQDSGNPAAPVTASQDFTFGGGGVENALGSSTTLTWTLAAIVNPGDKTLTVNPGPTPPTAPFSVVIDTETLTIQATSGNLWTIQGSAVDAHSAGATVTFTSASNVSTPQTTPYSGIVSITNPNLTTVNDYSVTINLTYPNLQQLKIVLVPPKGSGLSPITLVENHLDNAGNSRGNAPFFVGVTGANMGNLQTDPNSYFSGQNGHQAGTVFDDNAERLINDTTAAAPYVGEFRPEDGSLLTGPILASLLNGTWTLQITNFIHDASNPIPPKYLTDWSLNFTGIIGTVPFNNSVSAGIAAPDLPLSPTNVYSLAGTGPYGTPGVGPGLVEAVDNTLGGLSPYQGRIYLAYTGGGGGNTDVYLISSDDGGNTWSTPLKVNQDSPYDNFSQGNRAQFMPSITVDPTNGNVVISYYDARNDASNTRVANTIAVSNDGGAAVVDQYGDTVADFSPISYLNPLKQATDFLTGSTVTLQPIPGNQGVAGTFGFGDRQGLVAYGGNITPIFSTNLNAAGTTISTATVTVASGPRVISGDMGPITASQNANGGSFSFTYDTAVAPDGTQGIDGFVVTFDRPVDVASFIASDVLVQYQDPNTGTITPVLLDAVSPVNALDDNTTFGPDGVGFGTLATTFYIKFASPQFKVGTYSYAIGPTVQDDIRLDLTTLSGALASSTSGTTQTITVNSNASNAFLAGIPSAPFVIQVDSEQMLVTATAGGSWTVVRGYNNSTAAAHSTNVDVSFSGNQMDQNAVGGLGGVVAAGANSTKTNTVIHTTGQDMFAIPTPINGVPFEATYDPTTLPLIIPGPHVISTSVPNQPFSSDNLVLNATNGALDVLFDRNIAAGTFTAGNIISITGPVGPADPISLATATVTQDATNKALFHITFPTQTLSGTYNFVIAPRIPPPASTSRTPTAIRWTAT